MYLRSDLRCQHVLPYQSDLVRLCQLAPGNLRFQIDTTSTSFPLTIAAGSLVFKFEMLATTFQNALAINIFMAIVNQFLDSFLDAFVTDNLKDHPCMVQE